MGRPPARLGQGKMKYYQAFLYRFRAPVIHSFFLLFVPLFSSEPIVAGPYAHHASFYPSCQDGVHIQAPADLSYVDPGYFFCYVSPQQPLPERFADGPSNKTPLGGNFTRTNGWPLNGDGGFPIRTDAVAAGCEASARSNPLEETGTQGRKFDSCKPNKQGLINPNLLSVSIRATFSSKDMIGAIAPEQFREYGAAATFRLPWEYYSQSGWGGGLRLMTGIGALYGAGDTAMVISIIPLAALGSQDGRFTLDMGAGGALLSRRHFGTQDFGGYFQFALTAGAAVPLYKKLGMGYRFLHYSDAGIYGPENTGADMHMLELTYRF